MTMKKALLILCMGFLLGYFAWTLRVWLSNALPVAVATLPDSGEYFGPMENGRMHGEGQMVWPNGMRYEGQFRDGLFSGEGRLELVNGAVYQGQFLHGAMHGKGVLRYSETHYYDGEFNSGQMSGHGKLVQGDTEYIGQFAHDMPDGQGSWKQGGNLYVGHFSKNKFHGNGMYVEADGGTYEGEFVNGQLTGEGRLSGHYRSYEGMFKDWQFNGEGMLRYPDYGTYKGLFIDGLLTGEGEFLGDNGTEYIGEFVDNQYQGYGYLLNTNGDVYEGEFNYGEYHGEGTLTLAEPVDDITEIKGTWEYGQLLESPSDIPAGYIPSDTQLETLIYNQHELLQSAFDQLKPNNPVKPDMYLLTVAGDGTERVFENEIQLINDYFDNHFDTGNRSVTLVNSPRSISDYPLATTHSFEQATQALAAQMDSDDDILFIYMTSHGSRDHRFSLDHNALSLTNLSAGKMATIINELPVKWKVIVLSACFSGGFIPQLQNDNTLVMTAASADKTSFGCGDFTEYTYFGDAFLNQALPQAGSFVEAFDQAHELVTARELEKGYENSNPQIHKPAAILKQLANWRQQLAAPAQRPVQAGQTAEASQ